MKQILILAFVIGMKLMASNGEVLSQKCIACHGASFEKSALGKSAIVYDQGFDSIYNKLLAYKAGVRNIAGMGALMKTQVANMSEDDLRSIAYYIASNERAVDAAAPAEDAIPTDPADIKAAAPAADNYWPFACEQPDLARFGAKRYFPVGTSSSYPLIVADTQTIQIQHKEKIIKVWLIWVASKQERQYSIKYFNKHADFSNFGYNVYLGAIDYRNMRVLTKSTTNYNCDGGRSTVASASDDKWMDIIPESILESITKKIMRKYDLH